MGLMNASRFLSTFVVLMVCGYSAMGLSLFADEKPEATLFTAKQLEFFESHVRPILVQRCYSCHSVRSNKREGGLLLDSRPGWLEGGERGEAIVVGDVDASLLIRAIRHQDDELQMPPDKPLPQESIEHFEQWIKMGAPDPRNSPASPDLSAPKPSDPIAGRDHWAFRSLDTVSPPTAMSDWSLTAIDRYVEQARENAQLPVVADADRRTLLRRVYFQVIGLPPTTEELLEFVNDTRPDAYQRVVDRLLSSPHFGERWGRHWLDLARFADSNGLDENFLFREAWRYRNWTIEAVNIDLPYDEFLRQQIAGDLLPYETISQRDQQRIAAGFLVVGPKVLLGINAQQQRMDVADEQLDTIGKAILGQTLGCARCHDHKFDPIPTADYYAMAGIFTSTTVMQQRYMLGQQRVMEQLVGLGEPNQETNRAYETYWRDRSKLEERAKQAKAALDLLNKGDESDALKKIITAHPDAVTDEAKDESLPIEDRKTSQKILADTLAESFAKPPAIPPRAMIPSEAKEPADEPIRIAGQFDKPGGIAPRGVLTVLSAEPFPKLDKQSGRLELVEWLAKIDGGAGQLTARVHANRVWHQLFGRGLVRTVDNFGRTGEPPTHPALLDHLARTLISSGWSTKQLVREIVLSRTFQLSSAHDHDAHPVDPDNKWLWRANRRRLSPEALRDAMLSVAQQLDRRPLDSTVAYLGDQATAVGDNKVRRRTDFPNRSVYLPVIRNDLPELFDAFDFANPHATTGMRPQTVVAKQGLFMLNDNSVMTAAESTARHIIQRTIDATPETRVDRIFESIIGVLPTSDERVEIARFASKMQQALQTKTNTTVSKEVAPTQTASQTPPELDGKVKAELDTELEAWTMVCHALFASSRFQVLE
jgi:hypothetical protein